MLLKEGASRSTSLLLLRELAFHGLQLRGQDRHVSRQLVHHLLVFLQFKPVVEIIAWNLGFNL